MSRDPSAADSMHVAFARAVRRLELRYGVFIHASPEWLFFSNRRPPTQWSVLAAIKPPDLAAALEREVDAEPRWKKRVLPS